MTRAKPLLSKVEGMPSRPSSEKREAHLYLRSWRLAVINLSVRHWWADHHRLLLPFATWIMLTAGVVWLSYQFWRLLWQPSLWGAIDLRTLHGLVHDWFAGRPVYSELSTAIQLPATYALLWPLLGWLPMTPTRWIWAASTVVTLGWLVYLTIRESGAGTPEERRFVALIPLSMYATGAAIGNGQQIVHILPMMVAGLALLKQPHRTWRADLLAAFLILITFVKPSVSVPFFWIVIFAAKSLRPAVLVGLGYALLTYFAVSFQAPSLLVLVREWLARSAAVAVEPGYGNVANLHVALGVLGLKDWILPTSFVVLLGLGIWIYLYRHVNLWLLLGVTAYVTRFWTYHRWYDDLLILLPMIALFRVAKQCPGRPGFDVLAGALLAITIPAMLAPGGLFLFPPPWNQLYVGAQLVIWLVGLIFLVWHARDEKKSLTV